MLAQPLSQEIVLGLRIIIKGTELVAVGKLEATMGVLASAFSNQHLTWVSWIVVCI